MTSKWQTIILLLTVVTLQVTFHHSGEPFPVYLLVDPAKVLLDVGHFVGEIVTQVTCVDSGASQGHSLPYKVSCKYIKC